MNGANIVHLVLEGDLMNILELRNRFRDKILQVARECHISSVKIFGSTIHGDATEKSDVDFLISLKKKQACWISVVLNGK